MVIRSLSKIILDFFFPNLCMHCGSYCRCGFICEICSVQLEIVALNDRCPICFLQHTNNEVCTLQGIAHYKSAFVSEPLGPALSMSQGFHDNPHCASSIASLMTVLICKISWPIPDVIIPIKIDSICTRSICEKMASFFDIPVSSGSISCNSIRSIDRKVNYSDKKVLFVSTLPISDDYKKTLSFEFYFCGADECYFLSFLS